jgi:hypothetical protein
MIPPVVIPKEEAMRKIYEIESDKNTNSKPRLRKFNEPETNDKKDPKKIDDPSADFYKENKEGLKQDPTNSNKNHPK